MIKHGPVDVVVLAAGEPRFDGSVLAELERQAASGTIRVLDAMLLFNFGVLLEDTKRPAEAMKAYEAALALDPRFADSHYNLALLYEAQGKRKEAIRHMARYRALSAEGFA